MSRLFTYLFAFTLFVSGPLAAEQRPVVVELFTSQGCSSCPPADALFKELGAIDNVIAIALHVDYWDYIGWKDEYGHPDHAKRQRAYAQRAGRRTIYTPEMIVNGQADIVGAKPMKLSQAIMHFADQAPDCHLDLVRNGDTVQINAGAMGQNATLLQVHMLRLLPTKTSKITRGENRGKTIEYSNIAQDWSVVGTWDGVAPLQLEVTVKGDAPVVVLLQEPNGGRIVAAARIN